MTKNNFGRAAEGAIPSSADLKKACIMGRNDPNAVDALATGIGRGVKQGHIDLTQIAKDADIAKTLTLTPGGGLTRTGKETTEYIYDEVKNETLFMGRTPDAPRTI
jgi:hypothetical protein